jgi:hypothetical protein
MPTPAIFTIAATMLVGVKTGAESPEWTASHANAQKALSRGAREPVTLWQSYAAVRKTSDNLK